MDLLPLEDGTRYQRIPLQRPRRPPKMPPMKRTIAGRGCKEAVSEVLQNNECSSVVCPTCSNNIEDATDVCVGQEALFCEGTCECWYHRWCVGVTRVRFQPLSESAEPFLCPACTSQQQQKAIKELQGCVQALTAEILELKAAVCGLQKTVVASAPSTREEGMRSRLERASYIRRTPGSTSFTWGLTPWVVCLC